MLAARSGHKDRRNTTFKHNFALAFPKSVSTELATTPNFLLPDKFLILYAFPFAIVYSQPNETEVIEKEF